jgi:hypothetical protein
MLPGTTPLRKRAWTQRVRDVPVRSSEQDSTLGVEAAVDEVGEVGEVGDQPGAHGGALGQPFDHPSGTLAPSSVIPSATTSRCSPRCTPSSITIGQRRSASGRAHNSASPSSST